MTPDQVVKSNTSPVSSLAWHTLAVKEVAGALGTDSVRGLNASEAVNRLAQYGANTIRTEISTSWYKVLVRQFVSALILILMAAAVIALAVGDVIDAVAILAIVALNGVLGFVQEWKAERAIAALHAMLTPLCVVIRDKQEQEIKAADLTPGDLVLVKMGDRVPADLRLVEALNLRVDEALLTGESTSVSKTVNVADVNAPLAERSCMAWMGTTVTNGRATGIVIATGMATEFGRIAQLTQTVADEATPLQLKLALLGKQLGFVAILISIVVSVTGWLLGRRVLEMFLNGVSLAVAIVPEGLPAVVTLTLALGIRAMVRRKALLRRLQGAETLGAATVVCTDKTGTLTQNEMTVQRIWLSHGPVEVTGVGYEPKGEFALDGRRIEARERSDLVALLETGLRCNHGRVYEDQDGWKSVGEPTEVALVVAAGKAGLNREIDFRAVTEYSFNSERKRMTIVEQCGSKVVAHVKGAPEVILDRCRHVRDKECERELAEPDRMAAVAAGRAMAEQGLRTLALARRRLPPDTPLLEESVEQDLTLLGIVGMMDPPRSEVPAAVKLAQSAGVRVIMITGDAAGTAVAVAKHIGMSTGQALTGNELNTMDDSKLKSALIDGAVFARTTPEHKIRIVGLLQEMGHVVGMTGDGVNDAPALKKADVGIAMGLRGTDVARGASDIILTDDNFASIVNAIEEGRRQYENIQKFVRYLLSSNMAEVIAIFCNILMGGPLILLPSQILWMNLVTDGMTAVALGLEPAEKGLMRRPPRSPEEPILDRTGIAVICALGAYMGVATLWLFRFYLPGAGGALEVTARTVAFTGLIVLEKMNVFNFRSLREPLPTVGFFSNPWLLMAWVGSLTLQVAAVYTPFLQEALRTAPLSLFDWGIMILVATPIFLIPESIKYCAKRWRN